jgi:hypothetical protein
VGGCRTPNGLTYHHTGPGIPSRTIPLTDLQKAYWLGRGDFFELGNIGCHVYVEVDLSGVDRRRLQAAWRN